MTLEKRHLQIGYVPLCDAATLIVARDRGFFAEQGLDVELTREPSWANIRDKLAVGALDGAQMLAPMPLAARLGLGNMKTNLVTAFGLNIGGNGITLSRPLFERMGAIDPLAMTERPLSARALSAVVAAERGVSPRQLTFAVVFPFSSHNYDLRAWLANGGINPDRDVRLVVVPPAQMVANLSAGIIDGYCVGEPWNSVAETLGIGHTVMTSQDLHGGRVEKVFAVSQSWADHHPQTHKAVLKALLKASQWVDESDNRAEVADIIAQPSRINAPVEIVQAVLERTDLLIFHRHAANFPWRSQALWYQSQMARWGQGPVSGDPWRCAEAVFRSDLHRLAARELGLPVPLTDSKVEGVHAGPWFLTEATQPIAMGQDLLFDGSRFDPAATLAAPFGAAPHPAAPSGDAS